MTQRRGGKTNAKRGTTARPLIAQSKAAFCASPHPSAKKKMISVWLFQSLQQCRDTLATGLQISFLMLNDCCGDKTQAYSKCQAPTSCFNFAALET